MLDNIEPYQLEECALEVEKIIRMASVTKPELIKEPVYFIKWYVDNEDGSYAHYCGENFKSYDEAYKFLKDVFDGIEVEETYTEKWSGKTTNLRSKDREGWKRDVRWYFIDYYDKEYYADGNEYLTYKDMTVEELENAYWAFKYAAMYLYHTRKFLKDDYGEDLYIGSIKGAKGGLNEIENTIDFTNGLILEEEEYED